MDTLFYGTIGGHFNDLDPKKLALDHRNTTLMLPLQDVQWYTTNNKPLPQSHLSLSSQVWIDSTQVDPISSNQQC